MGDILSQAPWSLRRNSLRQPCLLCFAVENPCLLRRQHLGSVCMTEYLIAARAAVILWTNLAVMPTEILFDAIEAELKRRGVEL